MSPPILPASWNVTDCLSSSRTLLAALTVPPTVGKIKSNPQSFSRNISSVFLHFCCASCLSFHTFFDSVVLLQIWLSHLRFLRSIQQDASYNSFLTGAGDSPSCAGFYQWNFNSSLYLQPQAGWHAQESRRAHSPNSQRSEQCPGFQ